MSAVLSRCNKSLLLSLRNCDEEMRLATAFLVKTYREVYLLYEELSPDFEKQTTALQKKVSEKLTEDRRYIFSHPLEVAHTYNEHPLYLDQLGNLKTLESS